MCWYTYNQETSTWLSWHTSHKPKHLNFDVVCTGHFLGTLFYFSRVNKFHLYDGVRHYSGRKPQSGSDHLQVAVRPSLVPLKREPATFNTPKFEFIYSWWAFKTGFARVFPSTSLLDILLRSSSTVFSSFLCIETLHFNTWIFRHEYVWHYKSMSKMINIVKHNLPNL